MPSIDNPSKTVLDIIWIWIWIKMHMASQEGHTVTIFMCNYVIIIRNYIYIDAVLFWQSQGEKEQRVTLLNTTQMKQLHVKRKNSPSFFPEGPPWKMFKWHYSCMRYLIYIDTPILILMHDDEIITCYYKITMHKHFKVTWSYFITSRQFLDMCSYFKVTNYQFIFTHQYE